MRVIGMVLGFALVAVVAAPNLNYKANAQSSDEKVLLQPGDTYVHNFALAERRDACLRLNYSEGTVGFTQCLQGYFPENPWFAG